MPHLDPVAAASALLANKTSGSNSLLTYMVANRTERRGDHDFPVFDPHSKAPLQLHYAVTVTNRTGIYVASPPGGTQDLLVDGYKSVEFGKRTQLLERLREIGSNVTSDVEALRGRALDLHTVAEFIRFGYRVSLEPSLAAALREASEEHGIALRADQLRAPVHYFEHPIVAKRYIQDTPGAEALVDFDATVSEAELGGLINGLRRLIAPSVQHVYTVRVDNFDRVLPVDKHREESGKLLGRSGNHYFERGDFSTLDDLTRSFALARNGLIRELKNGNGLARLEFVASRERLTMVTGIEATLVAELRSQGIPVESSASVDGAIAPVRVMHHGEIGLV